METKLDIVEVGKINPRTARWKPDMHKRQWGESTSATTAQKLNPRLIQKREWLTTNINASNWKLRYALAYEVVVGGVNLGGATVI